MKQLCMIGEGAWGTAVATLLAANGHRVKLWCHDAQVSQEIKSTRRNERYLPGIELSELIEPTTDLAHAVEGAEWIFEAIPVQFLRSVLEQARRCCTQDQCWVVLSKGIEQETLKLPTQIIDELLGYIAHKAVFAGPSFAKEVATQQITAVSVAATDPERGCALQKLLANSFFRPYVTDDIIGVQVGAAFKNVIALAVGMLKGAGYTDNTQAFLFTRGLHEMTELTRALGGKQETMYGLAGVGDLVLTAMGSLGRNAEVGRRLGLGQTLQNILDETGYIPEGINTVKSVNALARQHNLNLVICTGLHEVIFGDLTLPAMLERLMNAPLERECG